MLAFLADSLQNKPTTLKYSFDKKHTFCGQKYLKNGCKK